ncbi:DNA polymerase [soil metagenome]
MCSGGCLALPQTPIVIDYETRGTVSLDQVGGRAYANHPQLEILCAVFALPDGSFLEWTPGAPPPTAVIDLIRRGVPIMAHNAHGFDRFVWQRLGWPDATWIDSMHLARVLGLPGSLGALAGALLDVGKDIEGRTLTLALARLDRAGRLPIVDAATLARVTKYCRIDVVIVRKAWHKALAVASYIEPDVRELDNQINERGFAFDSALANAIVQCERSLAQDAQLATRTSASVLASPGKLRLAFLDAGIAIPDIRRTTLLSLLDDPDLPEDVRLLVNARLASSGITSHKLNAALRRVGVDGRLRDSLAYCQAHTGRWAGRGFQPQNLPRGALEHEADLECAIAAAMSGDVGTLRDIAEAVGVSVLEVSASLVRACVWAPPGRVLGVADYAQIEARALMWLAGDTAAVESFRGGVDSYLTMAAELFDVEAVEVTEIQRKLGKALVIGCGYQMGSARFESYARNFGVDWSKLEITPDAAVQAWRSAHPSVAGHTRAGRRGRSGGLWRDMEEAAVRAARGARVELGPTVWQRHGSDVVCFLPSGRPLVYRNVRLENRPTKWGTTRLVLTYEHRGQRVDTYGGKLTENVTQAVCRDLMAHALVCLDRAGIFVVLHVHDEIVAELEDESQLAAMKALMCTPPLWAAGLPLKATGHCGRRYRK